MYSAPSLRPVDQQRVRLAAAVSRDLGATLGGRDVERLEPSGRLVAQMRAPAGEKRTTSHARPRRSSARITMLDRSICHHFRPCTEDVGNAWWLLCQDSPNDGSASHA